MRIVVCVKHVPDLMAERRLDDAGRVVRDGGDGTLNELDENAVEAALTLAEEHDAEVVALTMGPDDAVDAVRRALQMGADRAVHVLDDALTGTDVFGTARVLAAAVRRIAEDGPVDLVVTGMASLDGLTSMLPAALSAELGLPQLTLAVETAIADGAVTVHRDLDHATEVLRAPLPALVSVTDQANEPRYPAFAGIMAARKKPVDTIGLDDLGLDGSGLGAQGARTEVLTATERPPRTDRVLLTDEGDAGLRLAEYLVQNKLV
ncbi:electron transfer flavoprotein subunit beta/FixA family protein [Actinotalea sp. M2MS4P-6]|uniref:electron transfer flavoprotein subunit beta/FixA family protein n=1 Tax=Actinotalea sp. M2MS4P-6 TaxID=2983762 RepID=UPI0021E4CDC4|nr:electron transfer flavoprotein subunit beta/FixA family protein [Actinotalea sp. M2MS4P-6]MCV2394059.1 electron transfer flavoprotein subunit beta/FixA family protein [Actinotalea sp. M2MS4P-6]